ncbi:formate-dependent phosphoribosylglycinamide formyltransferase [Mycolicibacterium vaccae]|uniref:Phosphoribosylglycinamide formyltransferase 2 n=1 Tax=Mycolicibacterium vaccae ATCC 25954 TaxID=1194972 RepID=K0UUM0_MYCVA|nr:formate-dependent phosphoribosylglycinamide formyltransferase [Mycolicibacterium vaccae]ANI37784.1 phosphoribosylglycinamide formyltransferase [Mycolicibacterium vaccae 95051]EJZ08720.1 phosphoribosylglycinamide formyltransferase 2 [Mycolicibacterium vaccae ATCC 25954]MCV7060794.1 formate-dependent phosphoribosylglycinamide formyltransferase [Mycolicibacterium vaccae]
MTETTYGETVLLLGAGARSSELALAFRHLGAGVATVSGDDDAAALTGLIDEHRPRYVVVDTDAVATDALLGVADREDVEVFPTPRAARLSLDREGLRKLAADELGLPTAPFWFAGSVDELTAIATHAGFPMVVKPVAAAPGEGESVLLRPEDVAPAWELAVSGASTTRVIAETVVEVDFEVTLLTVRTSGAAGPAVHFCEPIGHHQNDAAALESWQPQRLSPIALDSAKSIAARIVNSLGGRGVFAVELLVRGDEVYFSDVRPRLQDSGLVTLRSQRLSQFELHARAILGLPVDTIMISPGAVEVSYSDGEDKDVSGGEMHAVLADALAVAESDVRVFRAAEVTGDGDASWLSWSTATAQDPIVARDRARRVASAVRRLR